MTNRTRALRGQAVVEYVVLCAVIAGVMGLGLSSDSHDGVIAIWLDALRTVFLHFSFALSLPT